MSQLPYAASFKIKSILIYQVESDKSFDITDLAIKFDYFENIHYPTVSARLMLVDSVENLIASLPIQGFEKVEITLEMGNKETYEYSFRVYKIDNRFGADRFQTYSLGLISTEALLNEGIRVAKTLRGKPDSIVQEILQSYLKTEKEITVDKSVYNMVFQPGKKSPFSIISAIKTKAVPEGTSVKSKGKSSTAKSNGGGGGASDVAATDKADYQSAGGTAGYFFYENRDGYFFKSVDSLCSTDKFNGEKPVATYIQENANVGGSPDRKILDIDFNNEIDIMSKLRMGAYSSLICFYNYSTGAYEEYVYSLAKEYENMGHMGSQKGLPYGQKELSKYPTRIMSVLLDHETWFDGEETASPEERDGANGKTSGYPDFQKYYISQSISRYHSLENQKVNLTVTGNPALKIGDKIEILIPNQIPTSKRTQDLYDSEHSGTYLISEVNHAFSPKDQKCTTYLTLIRDSYGRQDSASKVK
jgi:hypothetical protein